ncbi:ABC transporter [Streptomyces sp. PT12]|nr:ABC transporter [Streptomyces sp. PT12]
MKGVLAFEWTKLWSVRTTPWSLVATMALTVLGSAVVGGSATASAENGISTFDAAPDVVAEAILLAQLTLVALAALAITGEYSSGSITSTLHSVPIRGRMLAGKALVVGAVIGGAGLLLSAVGTATAAPLMGELGAFTAGEAVAAALGTAGYVTALAMIALGLGTVLRGAAGTITSLVLLLIPMPQLMKLSDMEWLDRAADLLPSVAGSVLMTNDADPYGLQAASAILLVWSLTALVAGYVALRSRDA